jgi:hypothetical protein
MRAPYNEFFEIMSDKVFVKGKKDTQFCGLVTGSPENKESFAGLHANKVVVLVDEASALPSEIFDTLLGTLSKGECHFVLVSNPVRASGAFYQLFQGENEHWDRITFDSYGSPNVDQDWIDEVIAYYGETSDFVKMRIKGEFPSVGNSQFISSSSIQEAMNRILEPREYMNYPRVLGCDPARFGDDTSVMVDRQGPKIHGIYQFQGLDTIEFAQVVLNHYRQHQFTQVFVDGIGVGAGVVDQLKRFNLPVVEVTVNSKSSEPKTYSNLRAQVYGRLRDWLASADLPHDDKELFEDLSALNYFFNNRLQIVLEAKKDMKKRTKRSPDRADALSLTFAQEVYSTGYVKQSKLNVKRGSYLWV